MTNPAIPVVVVLFAAALTVGRATTQLVRQPPPPPEYGPVVRPVFNPILTPIQLGNRSILSIDPAAMHREAGNFGASRGGLGVPPGATQPPVMMGFPNFGPNVPGYGGFPGQTGLPVPFTPGVEPNLDPIGIIARPKDSWPSWFADPKGGKFTPENALLVRGSDRVWFLAPDDTAFIPLAFHDKFRRLRAGAEVEVRHKGEFQITFHGGGTLRSRGKVRIVTEIFNEEIVAFRMESADRAWLNAKGHPFRMTLPDGSILEALETSIYFAVTGDLMTVVHDGHGKVTVRTPLQTVDLAPSNFIRLSTRPPTVGVPDPAPHAARLGLKGDLEEQRTGRVLEVKGGARGGAVVWNGAQFRVAAGASLRIDPLAGDTFPENRKRNP